MSNMDLPLRKKPFKAYTELPTQFSALPEFVTTDINEELLFASKFFENHQIDDKHLYWMGLALKKEIGWVVLAFHYFGIVPDYHYRHLTHNYGGIYVRHTLSYGSVKLNTEWVENPMKIFEECWSVKNEYAV